MRHLTAVAAALAAFGMAAASAANADPTDPTTTPVTPAAESTSATPTSAAPGSTEASSTVSAAPEGPQQVTYTITTTSDLTANIYYVIGDPPDQASANKPEFMPMARTMVGPSAPWTFQTNLEDPTKWAFVSASGGLRVNPEFRCEIAVDGKVVVSQQGGSGVQCALRPW